MNEINSKELGIFEMMVIGFDIFKKNLKPLFTIMLIIGVPINIILTIAGRIIVNSINSGDISTVLSNQELFDNLMNTGQIKNVFLAYFIMLIMEFVFWPLITAAVADLSGDYLNNVPVSAKKSILNSLSRGTTIAVASILHMALCVGGMMIFLIPGLIFSVWFYFFVYEIIYNNAGVVESLMNSKRLVKGAFFKIAIYLLFLNLLSSALSNIISMFIGGLVVITAGEVFVRVVMSFAGAYIECVLSVLYLNRKSVVENNLKIDKGWC